MMKRIAVLLIVLMALCSLTVQPAQAEWKATLGYGFGDVEVEHTFWEGGQSVDADGLLLGLDYTGNRFGAGAFYIHGDLDDSLWYSDSLKDDFSLRELYGSVRLFKGNRGEVRLLLSDVRLENGDYRIDGILPQLAGIYQLNERWSVEAGVGYALDADLKDSYRTYESPSLKKFFVNLNYRMNDRWGATFGYLDYRYDGEESYPEWPEYSRLASASYDYRGELSGKTQIFIVGLNYRFGGPKPVEEPQIIEEPQPEPPKVEPEPEPKPEPQPEPEPQPTPEPIPDVMQEPKPDETPQEKKERVERINQFLEPIFFDFDKSNIRKDQLPVLEDSLKVLSANKDLYILVAGHADPPGTNEYNQRLSERRAKVVADWLIDNGIDSSRITMIGYGEEYPFMAQANSPAWESDRWVDIVMTDEEPTHETGIRK